MIYKIKRIKKGITITSVALAILSTLIAVILLLGKGSNTAVVAHAADETVGSDFTIDDVDFKVYYNKLRKEYILYPEFNFTISEEYKNRISDPQWEKVMWNDEKEYYSGTQICIYLLRTESPDNFTANKTYTTKNFGSEFTDANISLSTDSYMPRWGKSKAIGSMTTEECEKDYYYFLAVVGLNQSKVLTKKDQSTTTETVTVTIMDISSNFLHFNYKDFAYKKLCSNALDNADETELQLYREYAEYNTDTGNVNVTFKYRNILNLNTDEIKWETENYQVENLKSLSKTYVYDTVMKLCGKSSLSDFNVVRQEVGYTVNGNSDSAFLQDEYTLLEANGYEYEFNKETNQGELTITYGDFAAKDFTLTVRTNDDLHSVLFIRSGDIKTAGGTTTITFDTSNIKTRLSNNFNWNVDNTDFNNYIITNPYESGVTFNKNLTGSDVTSITVTTADTNLLVDCILRLEIQVVPPVELTVTVKYLHLSYENGEITEEWKTKVLDEKILSTPNYTKINKTAFYDGDSDIGVSAQGDFIEENLSITDSNGNQIERFTYDGVTLSAADNATATAMITVKYVRNSLFRVYDSFTDDYYFVKTYSNSLNYTGSDFIVEHDGYRVKSIESDNDAYARIETQSGVYDWKNAKVYILCQLSAGNIIPLKITYSDKWQVNVEYLETYYKELNGKKTPTGFAVKKTYGKEIKVKGTDGELTFADINKPTADEIAKFLGKKSGDDLTVITFGAVDKDNIEVSCINDVFNIKLSYGRAMLKAIQANGDYEFIFIPLSNFADWVEGYGKEWTILVLNTNATIAFHSEFDVDPKDLYGYFYVVMYKEQVKNLDGLFAGYTANGCRSFYSCKKVVGNDVYRTCENMGVLSSILCLGINKIIQAGLEAKYDDYGTYYSYFLFVDGSSMLTYAANNKAHDYFDTDSAAKNTFQNAAMKVKNFFSDLWSKLTGNKKLMFAFWLVIGILLYAGLTWLFTKMGLMNGFFKYLWIAVAFVGVIIALYFGITIFA